jgi:GT2 family glycosyltransferase
MLTESLPGTFPARASSNIPVVLVGIATRNRAEILDKAIRSALAQSYCHVRVAVVDDGSEDATPVLRSEFPHVRWERWDVPRGYMDARNHLMRSPDAQFYLSLDDDAWFVEGDEIVKAIEYLNGHPRVGAIAFDILSPDRPKPVTRSSARAVPSFIGCGHVLRLDAVREVGDYAASPGEYGSEEKDLCLRLLDKGWDVQLLPGVHVWHDKTLVARDEAAQHKSGVCNDLVFALRRCPFPLIVVTFPIKLLNHVRSSFSKGLGKPCMAGIGLFFLNAIKVWKQREPVRAGTFGEFLRRSHETL